VRKNSLSYKGEKAEDVAEWEVILYQDGKEKFVKTFTCDITDYTLRGLEYGTSYQVKLRFTLNFGPRYFGPHKSVHFYNEKGNARFETRIPFVAPPLSFPEDRSRDIEIIMRTKDWKYPINILMMGNWGAGKSSCLNSVVTALSRFESHDRPRQLQLQQEKPVDHVTTKLEKVIFRDAPEEFKNLRLWDTWGWAEGKEYTQGQFQFILQGHLPSGWDKKEDANKRHPKWIKNPEFKNRIHAIIFVIEAEEPFVRDPTDLASNEYYARLRSFVDIATEEGYIPICAMSKIDKISRSLQKDLSLAFEDEAVQRAMKNISVGAGFNPNAIFPCKFYSSETSRNDWVEAMTLGVFAEAIRNAKTFRDKVFSLYETIPSMSPKSHQANRRSIPLLPLLHLKHPQPVSFGSSFDSRWTPSL